jgi:hypothetical protein
MQPPDPLPRQILEEDLLMVRATLETISNDVRRFSGHAADAIREALEKLELAEREFARASEG